MSKSHEILDIKTTASIEEIKAAHLKLAKRYHPDLQIQNSAIYNMNLELMKEINNARDILLNLKPEKKTFKKSTQSSTGTQYNKYDYAKGGTRDKETQAKEQKNWNNNCNFERLEEKIKKVHEKSKIQVDHAYNTFKSLEELFIKIESNQKKLNEMSLKNQQMLNNKLCDIKIQEINLINKIKSDWYRDYPQT